MCHLVGNPFRRAPNQYSTWSSLVSAFEIKASLVMKMAPGGAWPQPH